MTARDELLSIIKKMTECKSVDRCPACNKIADVIMEWHEKYIAKDKE